MKQPKSGLLKAILQAFHQTITRQKPHTSLNPGGTPYSRRKFITDTGKALAVISAGSLLPLSGCGDSGNNSSDARPTDGDANQPVKQHFSVAIIGAGIAGLSCAWQLQKSGIQATIYEGSKRNGGRILTHYNDSLRAGIFPEFGGDFIDSNHEEMIRLAKEFNVELIDLEKEQKDNNLFKDIYFFDNRNISEEEILREFSKIAPKIAKDIESLGENYDTPEAVKLDNTPLGTYIDRLKCAPWLRELLHAAFIAEYGLDCSEQSTINMLCMINTETDKGFQVFGESDEKYRFKGGNSKIIEGIVSRIGKEKIKNNYMLTQIQDTANNQYLMEFENGEKVTADYVIMTIPFTLLRKVTLNLKDLTKEKKECIDQLGYGNNTKLALVYEGTPWRDKPNSAMGYLFHKQIVNGWDSSQNKSADNPYGAYVCYFGGKYSSVLHKLSFKSEFAPPEHLWRTQLPEEKISEITTELDKVFKGSKAKFAGKHVFINWIDYPFAKGSYSCYKTGQWTTISGMEAEPVGNILFAGEHCSADFQGFMNGAAETGKAAAEALIIKVRAGANTPG